MASRSPRPLDNPLLRLVLVLVIIFFVLRLFGIRITLPSLILSIIISIALTWALNGVGRGKDR